jgi:hypothetical protein
LFYAIFDKESFFKLLPSTYLDVTKFDEKQFLKYVGEAFLKVQDFKS